MEWFPWLLAVVGFLGFSIESWRAGSLDERLKRCRQRLVNTRHDRLVLRSVAADLQNEVDSLESQLQPAACSCATCEVSSSAGWFVPAQDQQSN